MQPYPHHYRVQASAAAAGAVFPSSAWRRRGERGDGPRFTRFTLAPRLCLDERS